MTDTLTLPEKLLLAALEARKKSETFTAEDLVVEAWKLYPDTFGLSGYAKLYPDSNRVFTKIMGAQGIRGKGWLRKVGEKQYRVTTAGLSEGEALIRRGDQGRDSTDVEFLRAELDRGTLTALDRIISTGAAKKVLNQTGERLTFHDACGFWDITARSNSNTLNARLASTTVALDRILEAMRSRGIIRLTYPTQDIEGGRDRPAATSCEARAPIPRHLLMRLTQDPALVEEVASELSLWDRRFDSAETTAANLLETVRDWLVERSQVP